MNLKLGDIMFNLRWLNYYLTCLQAILTLTFHFPLLRFHRLYFLRFQLDLQRQTQFIITFHHFEKWCLQSSADFLIFCHRSKWYLDCVSLFMVHSENVNTVLLVLKHILIVIKKIPKIGTRLRAGWGPGPCTYDCCMSLPNLCWLPKFMMGWYDPCSW